MYNQINIGPSATSSTDGSLVTARGGRQQETIVSELHGRFYEQTFRGNTYTIGNTDTALIAANAAATSLGAAAKPIIALWNSSATMNLVLLQTLLQITTIANSAVNPQGFNYYVGYNQSAISTGSKGNAINLKTFQATGSVATTFTGGNTALTGLTGNLAFLRPVGIGPVLNAAGNATAVSFAQGQSVENVDSGIIIGPNQILAIMNLTAITTLDVATSLVWEEVPTP